MVLGAEILGRVEIAGNSPIIVPGGGKPPIVLEPARWGRAKWGWALWACIDTLAKPFGFRRNDWTGGFSWTDRMDGGMNG